MRTLTTTSAVKMMPAFQQAIKDDTRHLRDLRIALRALTDNRFVLRNHLARLPALLDEFRDQLAIHFALEEACGHLNGEIDAAPHLTRTAEQLRGEHVELFETLVDIADEAEAVCTNQAAPERIRIVVRRVRDFDAALTEHEDNESKIVFEATERDIGGEG